MAAAQLVPYNNLVDSEDTASSSQNSTNEITYFRRKFRLDYYKIPLHIMEVFSTNVQYIWTEDHQRIIDCLETCRQNRGVTEETYLDLLETFVYMEEFHLQTEIQKFEFADRELYYTKGANGIGGIDSTMDDESQNTFTVPIENLSEGRPSIQRGDLVIATANNGIYCRGEVYAVNKENILLNFPPEFHTCYQLTRKYTISFELNRVPFRVEHQAIHFMRRHGAAGCFFKTDVPWKTPLHYNQFQWFNSNIGDNRQQRMAVANIVSKTASPMPFILFGPPGTGKTSVLVEAILQIWVRTKERVLVCAPTNAAANEITHKLSQYISNDDLFRYVAPSVPRNHINEGILQYTNYKGDNSEYFEPDKFDLSQFQVIITTLTSASKLVNSGMPPNYYSYVFIDESGQATESSTLVAIAGILTDGEIAEGNQISGQIILAGDPHQLGPIIRSPLIKNCGVDCTSMLVRLMNTNSLYIPTPNGIYNHNYIVKLTNSHRSHPAIMEPSNILFYDKELCSVGDVNITHSALNWGGLCNSIFPVIFHNVFGQDLQDANSPSYFNPNEVDIVMQYLDKLIGQNFNGIQVTPEQIGIISPYKKQAQKIKRAFSQRYSGDLLVGTVETFQGQERLIIIISTVRSDYCHVQTDLKHRLGFLQDVKRFNVALTRAKALLIVVGNSHLLALDSYWAYFILYCYINRSFIGHPIPSTLFDPYIPC